MGMLPALTPMVGVLVLGSKKRRLDRIARQVKAFAPSLTVTRPRFGSTEAICVELAEDASFTVAFVGRGLLVGYVVLLGDEGLESSDRVACGTAVHTNDRNALMILSRVADALTALSKSKGNTSAGRIRARNTLGSLKANLAAHGITSSE
jgi:hypothetical protein